jgi:hypothetical protein
MRNTQHQWLWHLLQKMESNSQICVANLLWNKKTNEAINESLEHDSQFCIGHGFSDQMYLIRAAEFKQPIYDEYNNKSNHYPEYGGELFEKRVYSWMLNHSRLRATYMGLSYSNRNVSKKNWVRRLNQLIDWH